MKPFNVSLCRGDSYSYRVEGNGIRLSVPCEEGEYWNRRLATLALDELEYSHGLKRKNIRFI